MRSLRRGYGLPVYFMDSRSMTNHASSPSSRSNTGPRMAAIVKGCCGSVTELATLGSRAMLRALREPGLVWIAR